MTLDEAMKITKGTRLKLACSVEEARRITESRCGCLPSMRNNFKMDSLIVKEATTISGVYSAPEINTICISFEHEGDISFWYPISIFTVCPVHSNKVDTSIQSMRSML